MSSGFCADCFKGVRHEGEIEGILGKFEHIVGYKCYVATPKGDYPRDKVVLFMLDGFGLRLENNLLLMDDFARNGYRTIAPDILNDDPAISFDDPHFNINTWVAKHTPASWIPIVDDVVAALKDEGVTRFGTTGYCFGAGACMHLALNNESHVTVLSHPSLLKTPDDFEQYMAKSKAPLLINSCEVDSQLDQEAQAVVDKLLGDGKFAPGYQRTYWNGCVHGFAVRGDLSDPKVKAGKEGAFEATVKFFNKYL
ncbi:hypothetical protein QCA50_008972 [Cerrena zonata]|uniref:Dienelactone hydrolase domain-containing protein n=1 Tax=Cerrena zonata TaxID=2478898 RepID=A0AAW0GCT0_9APHY